MYPRKLSLLICLLVACVIVWGVLPPNTGADEPEETTLTEELFLTTISADVEELEMLLREGADPNAVDEDGFSLLRSVLLLARRDPIDTLNSYVKTLLQYGANPNLADADGWTAMHAAAQIDNKSVMEALLESGGDPHLNTGIPSPYELALMSGNRSTVSAIERTTTRRPGDYAVSGV